MGGKGTGKYQERIEAGVCTQCSGQALDDSQYCAEHRDKARAWVRKAHRKRRAANRKAGRCAECGLPSEAYRCPACSIATGRIATTGGKDSGKAVRRTTVEGDGYARSRYAGRGVKGPPTKAASDATDLAMAAASLARGRDGLAAAAELGEDFSREVKRAAREAALGHVHHVVRACVEVLDRHKYPWRGDDE